MEDYQEKVTVIDKWIVLPVNRFISKSTTGGIILFISAILAIIIANSPLKDLYHHFWEYELSINFNGYKLDKNLHHWINDGLMSVFFFVVGLELKREIIAGELSNPKEALLPIFAAIGGMVFPALIYLLFNSSGEIHQGWGIPMATDIAFALGILFLLGDKVPTSLKIFLTALAIVDDLGAVLVIAFFYTSEISLISLAIASVFLFILIIANKLGIKSTLFYGIIGILGVWIFFLVSGVHATIAGVLVAFTIPCSSKINENKFSNKLNKLLEKFKKEDPTNQPILNPVQLHILDDIREVSKNAMPPLQRLEHSLHPMVTFIIMPIFAFANAGVNFTDNSSDVSVFSSVTFGVIFGLLLGKFIGVFGTTYILNKFKIITLPKDISIKHLAGAGFLASVGFTMSLFIANLAFKDQNMILQAKIGILIASSIGGLIGFFILKNTKKRLK